MEHGKIEENTVNSGIFNGWGDKGIGSIVEHDVFDRFYGDKSVKYRALKETIAKTEETYSKNTGFGGLSRRRLSSYLKFRSLESLQGREK